MAKWQSVSSPREIFAAKVNEGRSGVLIKDDDASGWSIGHLICVDCILTVTVHSFIPFHSLPFPKSLYSDSWSWAELRRGAAVMLLKHYNIAVHSSFVDKTNYTFNGQMLSVQLLLGLSKSIKDQPTDREREREKQHFATRKNMKSRSPTITTNNWQHIDKLENCSTLMLISFKPSNLFTSICTFYTYKLQITTWKWKM